MPLILSSTTHWSSIGKNPGDLIWVGNFNLCNLAIKKQGGERAIGEKQITDEEETRVI